MLNGCGEKVNACEQAKYGYYFLKIYFISFLIILMTGIGIVISARIFEIDILKWIGLGIIFYGFISTGLSYAARYIFPGSPVRVANNVIHWLNLKGTEHILDIGTGRGLYAIEAAKYLTSGKVIGIDLWDDYIISDLVYWHQFSKPSGNTIRNAINNAELEKVSNKVNFISMDANKLLFEENFFEVIICAYILSHLGRHSKNALREISRVIKDNGKLVIVDNVRDLTYFFLSTMHLFVLSYLRGKKARYLTESYWHSIISENGFKVNRLARKKGIIVIEASKI